MAIPKKPRAPTSKPANAHRIPADTPDIWTSSFVAGTARPALKNTTARRTRSRNVSCPLVPNADAQTIGGHHSVIKLLTAKTLPKLPLKQPKSVPGRVAPAVPKILAPAVFHARLGQQYAGDGNITTPKTVFKTRTNVSTSLLSTISALKLENHHLQNHTTDGAQKVIAWKAHVHDLSEAISERSFQIADLQSSELIRLKKLYNESLGVYRARMNPLHIAIEDVRSFLDMAGEVLRWKGRERAWAHGVQGFLREVRDGERELQEAEVRCELVVQVAKMRGELLRLRGSIERVKGEGWRLDAKLAALDKVAQ